MERDDQAPDVLHPRGRHDRHCGDGERPGRGRGPGGQGQVCTGSLSSPVLVGGPTYLPGQGHPWAGQPSSIRGPREAAGPSRSPPCSVSQNAQTCARAAARMCWSKQPVCPAFSPCAPPPATSRDTKWGDCSHNVCAHGEGSGEGTEVWTYHNPGRTQSPGDQGFKAGVLGLVLAPLLHAVRLAVKQQGWCGRGGQRGARVSAGRGGVPGAGARPTRAG